MLGSITLRTLLSLSAITTGFWRSLVSHNLYFAFSNNVLSVWPEKTAVFPLCLTSPFTVSPAASLHLARFESHVIHSHTRCPYFTSSFVLLPIFFSVQQPFFPLDLITPLLSSLSQHYSYALRPHLLLRPQLVHYQSSMHPIPLSSASPLHPFACFFRPSAQYLANQCVSPASRSLPPRCRVVYLDCTAYTSTLLPLHPLHFRNLSLQNLLTFRIPDTAFEPFYSLFLPLPTQKHN